MSSSKFIICFTTIALLSFCFAFAAVDEDLSPLAQRDEWYSALPLVPSQLMRFVSFSSLSYTASLGLIDIEKRIKKIRKEEEEEEEEEEDEEEEEEEEKEESEKKGSKEASEMGSNS
ncbi:hypothetical protein Tco_0488293 [Tanacetum coccineum]